MLELASFHEVDHWAIQIGVGIEEDDVSATPTTSKACLSRKPRFPTESPPAKVRARYATTTGTLKQRESRLFEKLASFENGIQVFEYPRETEFHEYL